MSKPPLAAPPSFKKDGTRTAPYKAIKPEDYAHSPIHKAVVMRDHVALSELLSHLPRPPDPAEATTESDSLSQEQVADSISSVVDRRDVPYRETPLHLAVRINDFAAVKALVAAGADPSLHDSVGWNPLQEAVVSRRSREEKEIPIALARHLHRSNWCKYRRRMPRFVGALRRMRDFYMEISFHFESSVIPFVGKVLPSDTYRIWKRDGNLRADMSLAGFDGLKIQRADQSFLFLGEGDTLNDIPWGSLLVVNRDKRTIFDAFESASAELSDSEAANFVSQTSVARTGMDVTKAELVGRTNWRWQEKTDRVGEWKAKVYDVNNVVFSFRSRKLVANSDPKSKTDAVLPLELDEDDDGFLVAENPSNRQDRRRHSSFVKDDVTRGGHIVTVGRKSVDIIPFAENTSNRQDRRRHSSFAKDDVTRGGDIVTVGRKSVDIIPFAEKPSNRQDRRRHNSFAKDDVTRGGDIVTVGRKSVDIIPSSSSSRQRSRRGASDSVGVGGGNFNGGGVDDTAPLTKDKEFVRSLKPSVWLTEQFPLKTEELLPLLDILASKVKAVKRVREILTTKFPPGTFPVKLAIPVVPTVRVVITFTKFVDLQPAEQFYTPFSSPLHQAHGALEEEDGESEGHHSSTPSSSSSSKSTGLLGGKNSNKSAGGKHQQQQQECEQEMDPFAIPSGYKRYTRKVKKSNSANKAK